MARPRRPGNTCATFSLAQNVAPVCDALCARLEVRTPPCANYSQTASAVISAVLIALAVSSVEVTPQSVSCLVTTANGNMQGPDNGSSCAFLGIPYAAPPLGALRWKPPQPVAPWSPVTLMATTPPPIACR